MMMMMMMMMSKGIPLSVALHD